MFPNRKLVCRSKKKQKSEPSIVLFTFPSGQVECQISILDYRYSTKNLEISDLYKICAKIFLSNIQTITSYSPKIRKSRNELVELKRI